MQYSLLFRILFYRFYFNSIGRLFPLHSAKKLIDLFSTPRNRVVRKLEIDILKDAEALELDLEGDKIRIYEWGKGDKYVLLSHGWESNAGSLGSFVKPMTEKGFRVISFDNPAHGSSGGKKANMLVFKQVLNLVVDHFGIPEIAIGHSLGANVLILLAYQKQINFQKTILISPFNQMDSIFREFQNILKFPNSLYNKMLLLAEERAEMPLNGLEFGDLGQKTKLNNILLMHDVEDKIIPISHSETMKNQWERVNFIPIQGSGHYKILWKKETIKNTKEFIQTN